MKVSAVAREEIVISSSDDLVGGLNPVKMYITIESGNENRENLLKANNVDWTGMRAN